MTANKKMKLFWRGRSRKKEDKLEEKKKWATGDKGKNRGEETVKRREREVRKNSGLKDRKR